MRKERYIAHLASQDGDVLLVSAADKLHNATAILKDHREIGNDLWTRATGHYPRLVAELDTVVSRIELEAGHVGVWPLPETKE